jgi:hypothetical protein
VCAAHCGYQPTEINASDERSAAALTAKLGGGQMRDDFGRPKCFIIDEVDGATGAWAPDLATFPFPQRRPEDFCQPMLSAHAS